MGLRRDAVGGAAARRGDERGIFPAVSATKSVKKQAEEPGRSRTTTAPTTSSMTPRSPIPSTTTRELREIEEEHPELLTPDSPRSGSAGSRSRSSTGSSTPSRCSRWPTPERGRAPRLGEAGRAKSGAPRHRGKRSGTSPSRRWTASRSHSPTRTGCLSGGDPRRRPLRRGGHPQPADDEVDPAFDRRCARAGRGARRGLPAPGGFARVNEQRAQDGEATFANPRNAAAGTIRQLDPEDRRLSAASIWCYGVAALRGWEPKSHSESLEWLRDRGFKVNEDISNSTGSTRSPSAAGGGRTAARRSTTRSMASSSRWTTAACSRSSASRAASRGGRSPGNLLPRPRRPSSTRSSGTSAAPDICSRSRCSSRFTSAASR